MRPLSPSLTFASASSGEYPLKVAPLDAPLSLPPRLDNPQGSGLASSPQVRLSMQCVFCFSVMLFVCAVSSPASRSCPPLIRYPLSAQDPAPVTLAPDFSLDSDPLAVGALFRRPVPLARRGSTVAAVSMLAGVPASPKVGAAPVSGVTQRLLAGQ